MESMTTTGRFGLHEVPGLPLAHRALDERELPCALWVSAPVPLSVDEVAAMLYVTLVLGEACTVAGAREVVTDLTVNGGALGVAGMLYTATEDRATGCPDAAAHWSACLDLAHTAIAADKTDVMVPEPRGVRAEVA
jgi:hypothetical protein